MTTHSSIIQAFQQRYRTPPSLVVRAPGRINLIGEHTDYNDGFVLPMAIDRAAWIALRPRTDDQVQIRSVDMRETVQFDLAALDRGGPGWAEYVKGVAWALQEDGLQLRGWEGVMAGDVPIGAGLSSSAAVELATARAFAAVSGLSWDPAAMALLCQRAENRWVGVNCGIMDQMISAAGVAGHALLIDCRTLDTVLAPLPADSAVVVLDTATRRGLVDSAYNERRAQCEAAAQMFGVVALRDVSVEQFEARAGALDPVTRSRARHVVTENARTLAAATVMGRDQGAKALGRLMDASHASLRDDFQVSSAELDLMVEIARQESGCLGARMTGAGFGGCAVALVHADLAQAFAANVAERYRTATQLNPAIYICQATDGASVLYDNEQ